MGDCLQTKILMPKIVLPNMFRPLLNVVKATMKNSLVYGLKERVMAVCL